MQGVKIRFIAAGPTACHCIAIDTDGKCYTWGRNEVCSVLLAARLLLRAYQSWNWGCRKASWGMETYCSATHRPSWRACKGTTLWLVRLHARSVDSSQESEADRCLGALQLLQASTTQW